MTLEAEDDRGQTGRSAPKTLVLPGRPFANPLSRAIIEQRRNLALDANAAPGHRRHSRRADTLPGRDDQKRQPFPRSGDGARAGCWLARRAMTRRCAAWSTTCGSWRERHRGRQSLRCRAAAAGGTAGAEGGAGKWCVRRGNRAADGRTARGNAGLCRASLPARWRTIRIIARQMPENMQRNGHAEPAGDARQDRGTCEVRRARTGAATAVSQLAGHDEQPADGPAPACSRATGRTRPSSR